MKANVNITTLYIGFFKDLSHCPLSSHLIGEIQCLVEELKSTTLYHKFSYKEYVPEPDKEYLENLSLLKAKIWAQGLQLNPNQKGGITYRYFKKLCILLNQEIKRITPMVEEPVKEPEEKKDNKLFQGLMINYRDNFVSKETYELIEETPTKKVFVGKKWQHTVCYVFEPSMNDWLEVMNCSYMEHPIKF